MGDEEHLIKTMIKSQICLELSNGELISYEKILSIFDIYNFVQEPNITDDEIMENFILIPDNAKCDIGEIIYKANEKGIIEYKRMQDSFYSEIRDMLVRKDKRLIQVASDNIPQDVQNVICPKLIKIIPESIFYNVLQSTDENKDGNNKS